MNIFIQQGSIKLCCSLEISIDQKIWKKCISTKNINCFKHS